jgi:hypothetical protein
MARPLTPPEDLVTYYPDNPPDRWHGNDQYLRNFNYAELRWAVNAFDAPRASLGDLDNEIHPLFAGLTIYPGLIPALRLASCYLISPSLLPFWYALLFGEFQSIPELSTLFGGTISEFRIQYREFSLDQVVQVQKMLLNASKMITIGFQTESIDKVDVWGHTLRHWNSVPGFDATRMPPGLTSNMYLNPEFLTVLNNPQIYFTPESRVRASFMLAHTLLHELAHALRNMRVPCHQCNEQLDFEPFFHDQREAEVGRALETFLFGGRISAFQGRIDARYGLCFNKWPDLSPDRYVRRHGTGSPIPLARTPQKKKWQTLYAIPHWWVQQQFSRSFWGEDVMTFGTGALRVPRLLGFRSRNNEWFEGDEGIESDDSSRGRNADDERMVRPGQSQRPLTPPWEEEEEEEGEGGEGGCGTCRLNRE